MRRMESRLITRSWFVFVSMSIATASFAAAQATAPQTQPASQPSSQPQPEPQPLPFTVTYDPAIASTFTGRVYVMTTTSNSEPRFGPRWFDTEPFFALDVTDWKPDTPLVFDDHAICFPKVLSDDFPKPPRDYVI